MGPLIHFQKVYTIAYLLIAVLSIFISLLLKNTKAKDLLFVRIVTIAYFVFYVTGQVLLSFHQNIAIMQVLNFINIYILEVFPVIYYLSLFKLINRKWNKLLHYSCKIVFNFVCWGFYQRRKLLQKQLLLKKRHRMASASQI